MKTKQKILTAILSVIIVMASMTSTIFAKTTFDDMVFDLQSLGIMTGDENGDLQLDKPVTRAEFASIIVRMMSMGSTATSYSEQTSFIDVPDDYWAKNDIEFLASINVISGTSANTFSPDDNIDTSAACKILVCALGYSSIAEIQGGYPTGYVSKANDLRILDTVDTSITPLTRREIAKMIYNSLDVDVMVYSMSSNGYPQYKIAEGNTFRNRFKSESNGIVTKLTGIVTATADAYLDNPISGMSDNEIEINGAIYEISDMSYSAYLGQSVDFFVEDIDSNVIISMIPSNKTTVTTISPDDLKTVSSSKVTYLDEDQKSKSIKYDKTGYYIYNNRVTSDWNEDTLMDMKNGSLTFIDNNDDNTADVIIAKEYTSFIVNNVSVDTNMVYLKENQTICQKRYLKLLSDNDDDPRVTVSDKDGNRLTTADINANNILTCYISPDEQMIEVVVTDSIVSGSISGIGKDYVVLDGEKYFLEDGDKEFDIKNGDEVDVYLNFNNEAAYIKKQVATEQYAYISDIYVEENGSTYVAKLVLPNTIQEKKEEVKDEDGGAAKVVSTLACQNKDVIELPISSKVSVNGIKYSKDSVSNAILKQVVIYSTNSKGELSKVTTPLRIGTGTSKYYNSAERTFGKTTGGAFGVNMDTLTICIPKDDPNPSVDDYLTGVEMNNGQLYEVKAFDKDEDSHMANLIVVTMTMKSGTAGLINTKSKLGMVQNCTYMVDEDDDIPFYQIDLLTSDGNEITYKTTESAVQSDSFTVPAAGDLLSYSLDIEYNIDAIKVLGSMDGDLSYGRTNPRLDYETFCGFISNIEYNQVSENLNRWVHLVSCTAPSGNKDISVDYEILKNSGPPIFIYDHGSKTSTFGTIDDIDVSEDEIFVSAANNTVRAVVILR